MYSVNLWHKETDFRMYSIQKYIVAGYRGTYSLNYWPYDETINSIASFRGWPHRVSAAASPLEYIVTLGDQFPRVTMYSNGDADADARCGHPFRVKSLELWTRTSIRTPCCYNLTLCTLGYVYSDWKDAKNLVESLLRKTGLLNCSVADPRRYQRRVPLVSYSFIFMQFSVKILQHNRLTPPPNSPHSLWEGSPGSATAVDSKLHNLHKRWILTIF